VGDAQFSEHTRRPVFEAGSHRIVNGICASQGITADVEYTRNYPALINSTEETEIARRATSRVVGDENANAAAERIMGSKDFAFMLKERPGDCIMVGNGADGVGGCMVHNPHYDFNDEILPIGSSYSVELTRELLPVV